MSPDHEAVGLDWSMSAAAGSLRVAYQLKNLSDRTIYVFDSLVVRGEGSQAQAYRRAPGKAAVMENAPGAARIVLGATTASNPMGWIVPPLVKPLAAGASASGSITIPLPLVPWHNLGWAAPFRAEPQTATLMVQYFLDEPEWKELPSEGAEALRVPMGPQSRTAIGATLPIPKP